MHHELKWPPSGILARSVFRVVLPVFLALCLPLFSIPASAQIDYGIDQTVWMMLYGVTSTQISSPAWLAADDDGDGVSNGAELAAGTNPFDRSSALIVTSSVVDASHNATLTFPTVAGKLYSVQSNTDVTNASGWANLSPAVQIAGDGTAKSLTAPGTAGTVRFYRIVVQDQDTDGDGVSDWAELITGFDPTTAHTNGATTDDHTALVNDLAVENVITVTATKSTATQPTSSSVVATDTATITITRGGTLHFSAITVPLSWSGTAVPGVDYTNLPSSVTFPVKVGSVTLTVTPLFNQSRLAPGTVTVNAMPGGGYFIGSTHSASAVISPAGNTNGTGLTGYYWNATSTTITPYTAAQKVFATAATATRLDPTVDYIWTNTPPTPTLPSGISTTNFLARWKGQVQPQYSETYYFDVTADDGVNLWVNGQLVLSSWSYTGSGDRLGSIALQAGVLYDIQLDYYQATSSEYVHLNWYSNSQTKQVIPSNRLYPVSATPAPPAIVSASTAIGFVNQPFAFNVVASTSGGSAATYALGSGSGPLPAGLTLNGATGLISGTPTVIGNYEVALVASNTSGTGGSVLNIQILPAGSGVTRELWQGLAGANISDIPLTTTPSSTDNALLTPEDNTVYSTNTGERLRGYFTPPTTGNYYFWLAGSNNAELWISDDSQTVNLVRRALVTAPGTASESWNDPGQTQQRSPWLALVAGQSYYYEVLHNTGSTGGTSGTNNAKTVRQQKAVRGTSGTGASSNVAVGFLQDATGFATTPGASAVVPAYLLTQYNYPAATASTGTLYATDLSPATGVTSTASGSAHIQLNSATTQAILHFSYTGLSSSQTSYAVYGPSDNGTNALLFDLNVVDKFHPELKTSDGGYIWNIATTSAVSAATIVSDIEQGNAYLLVTTVNFPNGELTGNFTFVNGSQTAPTFVADPGFTDDSASDAGAARFLNQAAYGAAPVDVAAVESGGYAAWISNQMSLSATHLLPDVQSQVAVQANTNQSPAPYDNAWWRASINAPDQLRQRVAFALSEIMVISDTNSTLSNQPLALASYYDTLSDNAFGNFRSLLEAVTLHPAMGYWLNMQGNPQGNLATGYHPNENYAREVMQLFTIGLNRLWPDGSLVLDSSGNLIPTYNQNTITNGFARVFTGWTWHQALQTNGQLPTNFYPATDWLDPMVMVKNYHELGTKTILDNVVLPPAVGYSLTAAPVSGSQADTTTAAYDSYCLADLESGLNNIFYHPNLGPYVCRQLIQRLVESNPSPAYLYRVVSKFNDDGTPSHVRGNMIAVINAILLDGEARNATTAAASTTAGKQREPLMRVAGPARTFISTANSGNYSQSGTAVMTITTVNPHHYSGGDVVGLDFTVNDTGNPPVEPISNPTSGSYSVLNSPAPTTYTFAVNAAGVSTIPCSQAANSNTLTMTTGSPAVGDEVYLKFVSGSFTDGIYTVTSLPVAGGFTVTVPGAAPNVVLSGSVILPKVSGYDNIKSTSGTTPNKITIATNTNPGLNVGDSVWIDAGASSQLKSAAWTVASVIDDIHFTITNTSYSYVSESNQGITIYPLVAPPLTRGGNGPGSNVNLPASKFDMGNTNSLTIETPLDAPTVFNFFYPDYEYPGTLSANAITTPEFQLTTDSNIVTLTNTVSSTILSSGNLNGLSNFKSGSINLDLSPYIGSPYFTVTTNTVTSGTTVTATTTTTAAMDATGKNLLIIDKLGDILGGGMLTQSTKSAINSFVNNTTNFPTVYTVKGTTSNPPTPATPTTSRDILRAVVQQILISPEYAIQR